MGETDPDMLLQLLADKQLNAVQDVLLGFCKYGAATTHWIEPGGDRQRSHVAIQAYKLVGQSSTLACRWENLILSDFTVGLLY